MFDYPHFEVLLAVAREGSFDHAAKSQGVSKSAISQTLKLLDLRMGVVTVCRESTQTTRFGNKLCRHLEHVNLLEQKFLLENGHLFNVDPPGPVTVKVAVDDDSISSWFTDVVVGTQCVRSKFILDLINTDEENSIKLIADAKVSAAISRSEAHPAGFACYLLGQHFYRATASPDFAKRYFSNGVTIEALLNAPSVRFDAQDRLRRQWFTNVFGEELKIPATSIHSTHGIAKICVEGSAWGMNPALIVDNDIKSGRLVELIEDQFLVQKLYLHVSQPAVEMLSPLIEAVCASARSQLSHPPFNA